MNKIQFEHLKHNIFHSLRQLNEGYDPEEDLLDNDSYPAQVMDLIFNSGDNGIDVSDMGLSVDGETIGYVEYVSHGWVHDLKFYDKDPMAFDDAEEIIVTQPDLDQICKSIIMNF